MQAQLSAEIRTDTGKKSAKKFRNEGKIPCVLYGHRFDPILINLDARAFKTLLRHEGIHGLLDLTIAGSKDDKHTVVVKEIQRNPIKDEILHIDFQMIRSDEELTSEVSLHFSGEPVGVKAGGTLQHYIYDVSVQCLPKDLPESIEVDVSGLDLKENLRIQDLSAIPGVRILNPPEEIVAAVAPKRVREIELPGEEGFEEGVEGEAAAEAQPAAESAEEENA
jgi:large subunit ribosomal protein L25